MSARPLADDFEAIGRAARELCERRRLALSDPRRAVVMEMVRERGVPEGTMVPNDILLEAGYTQADIDEMRAAAERALYG